MSTPVAAPVTGARKTTLDASGNVVLSNPGDFAKDASGRWWALHPTTGKVMLLPTGAVMELPGGLINTRLMTLTDGLGTVFKGFVSYGVWVSA
jgi:hypothetical protein